METLKTGSLAYFDSLSGLIPCKVVSIVGPSGNPSSEQQVTVRLTATRRAFKRGETLTEWAIHIVPRKVVRFRAYSATIGHYQVEATK